MNRALLTVSADNQTKTYGSANPQFTVHYTGFVLGQDAGVLGGSPSFSSPADTESAPGDYLITPSPGTLNAANYSFTGFTTGTLHVGKANQTINWANPSAISYGTALGPAQLNATVSVMGPAKAEVLSYAPAAGTVLNAGDQTLSVTSESTTYYNEATATVTIHVDKATPVISWSNPADITYGTALGSTQLNASSPVAGSFAYSPSAGAGRGDFVINGSGLAFEIKTTATFTGKITVVFYVPSITDPAVFNSLQIIRYVNGQPKVEKTTHDLAAKTISATVTSL